MINKKCGTSDYFGNNKTSSMYDELALFLKKKGIKMSDKNINIVLDMVENIENAGYENGYDNCNREINEY